jgi:hypothetical protein
LRELVEVGNIGGLNLVDCLGEHALDKELLGLQELGYHAVSEDLACREDLTGIEAFSIDQRQSAYVVVGRVDEYLEVLELLVVGTNCLGYAILEYSICKQFALRIHYQRALHAVDNVCDISAVLPY